MDPTVLVLIIVVVLLLIALVGFGVRVARRRQSEQLQEQFGPEYDRSVAEAGDRNTAEAQLRERRQRRSELDVRDLRPEERGRYIAAWDAVQRDFVDDPTRALNDADALVVEVMRVRGYPVEDFDRRAEDISVDHPDVVRHYREARSVRDGSTDARVDTERQRHALTSYRSLVEALVGDADQQDQRRERTRDAQPADARAGDRQADADPHDNADIHSDTDADRRPTQEPTR